MAYKSFRFKLVVHIFLVGILFSYVNCTDTSYLPGLKSVGFSSSAPDVSSPLAPVVPIGPIVPTAAVCTPPRSPVDTSSMGTVVGTGTPASCTETAFSAALQSGGIITFNCGPNPVTIPISSEKTIRADVSTTIDGNGLITLDGQHRTRILHFNGTNWQTNTNVLTVQNMTFTNAKSDGPMLSPAPPPCSNGYKPDAGGAAIFIRDGILRVFNSQFLNGATPSPGPDVSGGAIYILGSAEALIVGSTFTSNHGANGGAIGALFGNLKIFNSNFTLNSATGSGANYVDPNCHATDRDSGDGGNGGAVVIDGAENYAMEFCGNNFIQNSAGVGGLGGAIFRTPDGAKQTSTIDKSTFDGNFAPSGGAVYFHFSVLNIFSSTFSNNSASGAGGAIFVDSSDVNFINDTFYKNESRGGLGGALALFGNGGSLTNITFSGNQASGGGGLFGGAIAGGTTLTITNTLFFNNLSNDCGGPMACHDGASQGSNNLQWPQNHVACSSPDTLCSTGTVFRDSLLSSTIESNGGPTKTILPLSGSPALGAGTSCPSTDQRGRPRSPGTCTLGAVEGNSRF